MRLFISNDTTAPYATLQPEESRHCVRVLRMTVGDELWVSYYSCHDSMHPGLLRNPYEGSKPSVYLAKIPLSLFRDR